jgi:hypothetical protein
MKAPLGEAHPVAVQASQQLENVLTHADPLLGALHFDASGFVEHVVFPDAFVLQQVTNPVLPQVDLAAHLITEPLHCLGRVFAFARSIATVFAHFTYCP